MIRGKVCRESLCSLTTDFSYLCNTFYISLDTGVPWSMIWEMPQDKLSENVLMIKYADHNSSPQPETPASLRPELLFISEPETGTQRESEAAKSCQSVRTHWALWRLWGKRHPRQPALFISEAHASRLHRSLLSYCFIATRTQDRTSSIQLSLPSRSLEDAYVSTGDL